MPVHRVACPLGSRHINATEVSGSESGLGKEPWLVEALTIAALPLGGNHRGADNAWGIPALVQYLSA
jgi:hypothetical protein